LTYQADRPDKWGTRRGVFSCAAAIGEAKEDRAYASLLIKAGTSALPAINDALISLETNGERSAFATNAEWLLFAYARIAGRTGVDRLRAMTAITGLAFLQNGIDDSIAASLGLTSYVSASHVLTSEIGCRPQEPADALDRLITSWAKGDAQVFQASLGPDAKSALASMMLGRTWVELRNELWRIPRATYFSLGYRLKTSDPWAEPRMSREEIAGSQTLASTLHIQTELRNGTGRQCAMQEFTFILDSKPEGGRPRYVVNNSDLTSVLRTLAGCVVTVR
jgi:hypothetical protein